jgi:hypothetical protein
MPSAVVDGLFVRCKCAAPERTDQEISEALLSARGILRGVQELARASGVARQSLTLELKGSRREVRRLCDLLVTNKSFRIPVTHPILSLRSLVSIR